MLTLLRDEALWLGYGAELASLDYHCLLASTGWMCPSVWRPASFTPQRHVALEHFAPKSPEKPLWRELLGWSFWFFFVIVGVFFFFSKKETLQCFCVSLGCGALTEKCHYSQWAMMSCLVYHDMQHDLLPCDRWGKTSLNYQNYKWCLQGDWMLIGSTKDGMCRMSFYIWKPFQ